MYYVYLLCSKDYQDQTYIGLSTNLIIRIKDHNSGRSPHTDKFKPWDLVTYIAFLDLQKAKEFETYLKSGSGRAFAKKHLL